MGDPDELPPPPHAGSSSVIAASHERLALRSGLTAQLSRAAAGWAAYGSTGRRVEVALAEADAELAQRAPTSSRVWIPSAITVAPTPRAHVEDGLHHLLADPLLVHVAHQGHVDLEVAGAEGGHGLQARVAGAHVVDGEGEAEIGERVHGLAVEVEVLDDLPLGDLERHDARREVGPR